MENNELNRRLAEALGYDFHAQTDDEIDQALWSAYLTFSNGRIYTFNGTRYELPYINRSDLWTKREGKHYQSDIEAHVAAWRRDPPDYAGDLNTAFGLGDEMQRRGLAMAYLNHLEIIVANSVGECDLRYLVFSIAHASAYARALAAYRALGGENI